MLWHERPVYQDAGDDQVRDLRKVQAITDTATYNVDQCLWVWRHIADGA